MPGEVVEAVVEAGGQETAYRRAGTGRPVVLLLRAAPAGTASWTDPLFTRLAAEFRVVAPALPSSRALTGWVRDLVDGLGLDRPAVVVDASVAAEMVPVVASDDDRCRTFIVLHPTREGLPERGATVAYRSGDARRMRLLELCLDSGAGLDEVEVASLVDFLRQDAD
jgi:pimeloyl-ACP methyl ester carboxylesterase